MGWAETGEMLCSQFPSIFCLCKQHPYRDPVQIRTAAWLWSSDPHSSDPQDGYYFHLCKCSDTYHSAVSLLLKKLRVRKGSNQGLRPNCPLRGYVPKKILASLKHEIPVSYLAGSQDSNFKVHWPVLILLLHHHRKQGCNLTLAKSLSH